MCRIHASVGMVVALLAGALLAMPANTLEPLAIFASLVSLDGYEREKLDAGESSVKVLPPGMVRYGVFAATRVNVGGDRLTAWAEEIQSQRNRYVPIIQRLSQPPRIEDLSELVLDDKDLGDLKRCRPGDCGVKLGDEEIDFLRRAIGAAGSNWKPAAQQAFRRVVLARVEGYLADGHSRAPAYHDEKTPLALESEFSAIAEHFGFLTVNLPQMVEYLKMYPHASGPRMQSFMYWSKETLGARPIVSVTHASIVCSDDPRLPETLVFAKQVYATHYMTGSLAVTAITRAVNGAPRYLVYLNRSRVDVLDGLFGGFVRRAIERRIRAEAPAALQGVRRRLESGEWRVAESD